MTDTIRYYAHLQQTGEGCDHTLGCGHALRRLKATTLEAAKVEALLYCGEREEIYTPEARIEYLRGLKRVRILAVAEEHDIAADIATKLDKLRGEQAEAEKARKLAEIDRLKRQLGAP